MESHHRNVFFLQPKILFRRLQFLFFCFPVGLVLLWKQSVDVCLPARIRVCAGACPQSPQNEPPGYFILVGGGFGYSYCRVRLDFMCAQQHVQIGFLSSTSTWSLVFSLYRRFFWYDEARSSVCNIKIQVPPPKAFFIQLGDFSVPPLAPILLVCILIDLLASQFSP